MKQLQLFVKGNLCLHAHLFGRQKNGMGYKDDFEDGFIDDAPRIDYMRQHLARILKASAYWYKNVAETGLLMA